MPSLDFVDYQNIATELVKGPAIEQYERKTYSSGDDSRHSAQDSKYFKGPKKMF